MPYLRAKSFSSARKQKKPRIKIKTTFFPHREYLSQLYPTYFLENHCKVQVKRSFTHATCPPTNKGQYWHSQDTEEELAAVTVRTLNYSPKQTEWAASYLLLKPAFLDSQGIAVGRKVGEKGVKHLEKKDQWSLPCVSCLLASAQGTSSLWDQERALVSKEASKICWNAGPPKHSSGSRGQPRAACTSLFLTHCNFHFPCRSHFSPQAKN